MLAAPARDTGTDFESTLGQDPLESGFISQPLDPIAPCPPNNLRLILSQGSQTCVGQSDVWLPAHECDVLVSL